MGEKKNEVVDNTELVPVEVTEEFLREKLYEVRGVKVMLDADLAEIYGYETKRLNEQVKRNIRKFPEDFMFQVTDEEVEELSRCKNFTLNDDENRGYLFMNGQIFDSDVAYAEIYSQARSSIYVVDNFISTKTLQLLTHARDGVEIRVYSDNLMKGLSATEYTDFRKQYTGLKIEIFESGGVFHDRYIILDYGLDSAKIYLCGASSKDSGARITTILEDQDKERATWLLLKMIDSSKDAGKLMISVLSAVAEIERENIRVQTMEGRAQKAREGKWNGGFAPYGYKLVDSKLIVNEEEAEAIRLIYDLYVNQKMGSVILTIIMFASIGIKPEVINVTIVNK